MRFRFSLGSDYVKWLPGYIECRVVNHDRSAHDVAENSQGFRVSEFHVERPGVVAALDAIIRGDQRFGRDFNYRFYFFAHARTLIVAETASAGDEDLAQWSPTVPVTGVVHYTGSHRRGSASCQTADRVHMTGPAQIGKTRGLELARRDRG